MQKVNDIRDVRDYGMKEAYQLTTDGSSLLIVYQAKHVGYPFVNGIVQNAEGYVDSKVFGLTTEIRPGIHKVAEDTEPTDKGIFENTQMYRFYPGSSITRHELMERNGADPAAVALVKDAPWGGIHADIGVGSYNGAEYDLRRATTRAAFSLLVTGKEMPSDLVDRIDSVLRALPESRTIDFARAQIPERPLSQISELRAA